MWKIACIAVATLITAGARADSTPHLDGHVETDPRTGSIRGDLCVSNLPPMKQTVFLLNRGLNIREVRDRASSKVLDYDGFYDAKGVGDATRYTVDGIGSGGLCVSFTGAFPVYRVDAGERSAIDWKGQIAFDGHTIRAAEQTRFYPVVLDPAGAALEKVSYRLDVACTSCKTIYVNGAPPQRGPKATFVSETPHSLLLYAGDFPFAAKQSVYFVGVPVTDTDAEAIRAGVRSIAEAESSYVGAAYSGEPVFLTFASVSRTRTIGRTSWQFVTWPTIALDGRVDFSTLLEEKDGRRVFPADIYIAHEMAHFYFGTRFVPRGPLKWFLLESTAEFVAMKANGVLHGDAAYVDELRKHVHEALQAGDITPLDAVTDAEQIGDTYRYRVGPLLLIALEQYAGANVVQSLLHSFVVDSPTDEPSYAMFRARLEAAGAAKEAIDRFERDCLHTPLVSGCLTRLDERQR